MIVRNNGKIFESKVRYGILGIKVSYCGGEGKDEILINYSKTFD